MVSLSDNYNFIESIEDIESKNWNDCVGFDHPFTRYEYLYALEKSGSASPKTGWKPFHYIEKNSLGEIIAVCPLYIKSHSFGEYIFDHAWAQAYHRNGLNYYPKLQSAIPFTPVTGERIIIKNNIKDKLSKKIQIINNIVKKTKTLNVSSLHFNFVPDPNKIKNKISKVSIRQGIQFHWKNNGYESFNEFLNTLSSRKRKLIKKERLCLSKNNLKVKLFTGSNIKIKHLDFFYNCYLNTTGRKWGSNYLSKDFFLELGKSFSDKILLIIAFNDKNEMIASAINFISPTHLYGRMWGSVIQIPFLHFEICYYQAIEYAIKNKIQVIEAGAQGDHKIQRGYMPENTWSIHWIKDSRFKKAINHYLDQEMSLIEKEKINLEQFAPYKQN